MNVRPRVESLTLFAATAVASWYAMMIVHESGHVLAAWMSGGRVSRVVLHPLAFSRTDLAVNPRPTFVALAGAVWGGLFPLVLWGVARAARWRLAFLLRAFAGFCLIANGAYLASAAVVPVGDAADLLRLGFPLWIMVLLGVAGFVGGLATWNGLGPDFGFDGRPVDRRATIATVVSVIVLVGGMIAWSAWGL